MGSQVSLQVVFFFCMRGVQSRQGYLLLDPSYTRQVSENLWMWMLRRLARLYLGGVYQELVLKECLEVLQKRLVGDFW